MPVALTRAQVREVDRIAIEDFGIPGLVLMENAGRNAAEAIHREYQNHKLTSRIVIFCGKGNNGGDGFVIARHLANVDHSVVIAMMADADQLTGDAAINYRICQKMGLNTRKATDVNLQPDDTIVDALLGTGFSGIIRDPLAGVIEKSNNAESAFVVAIDVPSGLDCDTGQPANACIRADLTVTFVAAKVGFTIPPAPDYTGRVEIADIGVPRDVLDRILQQR